MAGTNGRVTLAKLEQKVEDFKEYTGQQINDLKVDIKEIKNSQNDMMAILTSGDGKIKRNWSKITDHIDNHWKFVGLIVSIVLIIVSLGIYFI